MVVEMTMSKRSSSRRIDMAHTNRRPSAWAPLRRPLFRALWIATVVSNIGTWMHDVGASWLMTSLAPSPLMVALVQAATSLPMVFLALPAGALADIVDRRGYLIVTQLWMLATAALLGTCTWSGMTNAWLLLVFTLALGGGAAMTMPAWAAIAPELVPREELQAAVTLNGLGMNVARAIGPALAGLIVAAFGPATVFLLNAVSFLGVLAVLFRWRRTPRESTLPAERLSSAPCARGCATRAIRKCYKRCLCVRRHSSYLRVRRGRYSPCSCAKRSAAARMSTVCS